MKKTNEELRALLCACPLDGTPWIHYKTKNLYWIQGRAISEDTQEPLVIYHQQDGDVCFARPLREWNEVVEYPDGTTGPRFRSAKEVQY